MLVRVLTQEQANLVTGNSYAPDLYFNPIEDADGNMIMTEQVVQNTTNPDFQFVKTLPQIPYKPKV